MSRIACTIQWIISVPHSIIGPARKDSSCRTGFSQLFDSCHERQSDPIDGSVCFEVPEERGEITVLKNAVQMACIWHKYYYFISVLGIKRKKLKFTGRIWKATMKIKAKRWWLIFKTTGQNFLDDKPFIYSSSIAYFAIFSLPAVAIITVMIAGSFYQDETVRNEMLTQVAQLAGQNSAMEVERLMDKISRSPKGNLTQIISIITLFFSATTVFVTLQESINSIWKIKPKPEKAFLKFVINRLLSLAMICFLGFLVLLSLVTDTAVAIFGNLINQYLSGFAYHLIWVLNTLISSGILAIVFGLIYMVLPDASIQWRYVWVGAVITTILFLLGKFLIGLYLSRSDFTQSYGAAGSLVALLAWVYYSVLIVLFGAEFTYAYTKHLGGHIRPSSHAVAIREQEIEIEDSSAG